MLIIFMISLVCSEKMWNKSLELRRRHYGKKLEWSTMLGGALILGIGEIVIPINSFYRAAQQIDLEHILLTYVMLACLTVVYITATLEGMKKFKRNTDKLVIFGISLTCLLIGYAIALVE